MSSLARHSDNPAPDDSVSLPWARRVYWILGAAALVGLWVISRQNYLLFHSLVELFSIAVAWSVFLLMWNARRFMRNDAAVCLGIGYLFVGLLDLLHVLAYKGLGVFTGMASDQATQLWVAARGLETLVLLLFVALLGFHLIGRGSGQRYAVTALAVALYTAVAVAAIFRWRSFPTCYAEGVGLTPFKVAAEYVICLTLLVAVFLLYRKRRHLDPSVHRLMASAISVTIATELAFTLYVDVYGLSNLVGHYLKIVSFFLVYLALIRSSLRRPYETLFRQLRESEARQGQIVGNTEAGYFLIDAEGCFKHVNAAWLRLHKYETAGEVIGQHFSLTQVEGDLRDAHKTVEHVLGGREIITSEFSRRCMDGSIGYHTFSAHPVVEEGVVVGLEGFLIDVTERVQAEAALRESEERYRSLFENMETGFALHEMVFDATGKPVDYVFLDVNEAFERQTALRRGDLIGRRVTEALSGIEADPADWIGTYGKVVLSGESVSFESYTEALQRWYTVVAYRPQEGQFAVVFTDITDRKRMEEEVRKSHNLESLGVLAGGIAHDFNNVLTGITGNLALLERMLDKGSEEHEIAGEAKQAASRTRALTQQLMTFAGGGAPVKEAASIEALIRETTALSLRGSGTKPEFRFAGDLPWVAVDTGQISQVVQNLVLNADQAMPNGGVLAISAESVEVSGEDAVPLASGTYVRVVVEDQGVGIPENILQQVFDPYFSTKEAGHGLGLSICHSIIQRHGGHIAVRSEVGAGTVFTFHLPASEEEAVAVTEPAGDPIAGTGRILLMDDEETVQRTVGRMLGALGYEVSSAKDGAEALQAYTKALESGKAFDLVIMDLTIPGGMGGKEAMVKLHDIDPDTRVIVASGYANDPVMADPTAYGFVSGIRKPIDLDELAEAVAQALKPVSPRGS
jgi:PAS domain S-box-containing protein